MTLQTIKNEEGKALSEEQIELSEFESLKLNTENKIKLKLNQIHTYQKDLESMRSEVDRIKRRADLLELQKLYQILYLGKELHFNNEEKKRKNVRNINNYNGYYIVSYPFTLLCLSLN